MDIRQASCRNQPASRHSTFGVLWHGHAASDAKGLGNSRSRPGSGHDKPRTASRLRTIDWSLRGHKRPRGRRWLDVQHGAERHWSRHRICPEGATAPGGVITYTGTVRNSGNVTLNNVTVVNSQSSPSTVLTLASLAPGASNNFTATFTTPRDACSVKALLRWCRDW